MNSDQAKETAKLIAAEIAKLPASSPRPKVQWSVVSEEIVGVELWTINPRAGNRNLHVVRDYAPDMVAAHVRTAIGRANKADAAAFARIASIAAVDAE